MAHFDEYDISALEKYSGFDVIMVEGDSDGFDLAHCACASTRRCIANLAPFAAMGLCPERDVGDPADYLAGLGITRLRAGWILAGMIALDEGGGLTFPFLFRRNDVRLRPVKDQAKSCSSPDHLAVLEPPVACLGVIHFNAKLPAGKRKRMVDAAFTTIDDGDGAVARGKPVRMPDRDVSIGPFAIKQSTPTNRQSS
jgi:hypothetical protein